jgi:hypothetical protein
LRDWKTWIGLCLKPNTRKLRKKEFEVVCAKAKEDRKHECRKKGLREGDDEAKRSAAKQNEEVAKAREEGYAESSSEALTQRGKTLSLRDILHGFHWAIVLSDHPTRKEESYWEERDIPNRSHPYWWDRKVTFRVQLLNE